jgi:hypothetical protein
MEPTHLSHPPKSRVDTLLKLMIIACISLISLSIFYFLVIYIPEREEAEREAARLVREDEKRAETVKQTSLNFCLRMANLQYSSDWDHECESQGLEKDCRLPLENVDIIEERLKEDRDSCYIKYK